MKKMKNRAILRRAFYPGSGKRSLLRNMSRRVMPLIFIAMLLLVPLANLANRGLAGSSDAWDLGNFVTSVEILDSHGSPIGGSITDGDKSSITIAFAEHAGANGQFGYNGDGYLVYTLPASLALLEDVSNGEIRLANSKQVGSYTASAADGVIKVHFGDFTLDGEPNAGHNFIDFTDAAFVLRFEAEFRVGGDAVEVDFGDGFKVTFTVLPPEEPEPVPPGIDVVKTADSGDGGIINYEIVITATGDAGALPPQVISGIEMTDTPFVADSPLGGTQTPVSGAARGAYFGFSYQYNDESEIVLSGAQAIALWSGGSMRIAFDRSLSPGETVTLRYSLDTGALIAAGPPAIAFYSSLYIGNDVTVQAGGLSDSDSTVTLVSEATVAKQDGAGGWAASVDGGRIKLNGKTITDTQTSSSSSYPMIFPAPDAITIRLYTAPGAEPGSMLTFTAADLMANISFIYVNTTTNRMELAIPAEGTGALPGGGAFPAIYRVELLFDTAAPSLPDVAWPSSTTVTHTNTISYLGLVGSRYRTYSAHQTGVPVDTTGTFSVTKSSSGPRESSPGSGVFEIDYTIVVSVPAGNLNAAFYFRDTLEVVTGTAVSSINNMPKSGPAVALTPAPTGAAGDPDPFVYTYAHSSNSTYWYLYFGAANISDSTRSVWQYSAAKDITITYTVSFALETTTSPRSSIEKLLKADQRALLRNTAAVRVSGGSLAMSITYDAWPIHKSGEPRTYDPSVFDFTVSMNRNAAATHYSLFSQGAAVFTDTFDSALELVPGSFYARTVSALPYTYYRPVADPAVSVNGDGRKTFSVDLSSLIRYDGADTSGVMSIPVEPEWYAQQSAIEIHYSLRIPDPGSISATGVTSLSNTAQIAATSTMLSGITFSDSSSVDFVNRPLSKGVEHVPPGGNAGSVEIIINPHGWSLDPAKSGMITAVDTMSDNLRFYQESITAYTRSMAPSGAAWGSWEKVEGLRFSSDGTPWTWYSDGMHRIIFAFPDETPVRITYDVLIMIPAGQPEKIENTVEVCGRSATTSEDKYIVTGSTASASASKRDVFIVKNDEEDGALLSGAGFDLYMAIPGGGAYDGMQTKTVVLGDTTFYYLTSAETSEDGRAQFDSDWLTPSHKAVYLLVETYAPEGYALPTGTGGFTPFILHSPTVAELSSHETKLGKPVTAIADNTHIDNAKIVTPPDTPGETEFPRTEPPGETDPPPVTQSPSGTEPPPETESPTEAETPPPPKPPTEPETPPEQEPREPGPIEEHLESYPEQERHPVDGVLEKEPGALRYRDIPDPSVPGNELIWDDDGWLEIDEDGVPLGKWFWHDDEELWIFDPYVPLAEMPRTGRPLPPAVFLAAPGALLGFAGIMALRKDKSRRKK